MRSLIEFFLDAVGNHGCYRRLTFIVNIASKCVKFNLKKVTTLTHDLYRKEIIRSVAVFNTSSVQYLLTF